MNTRYAYQGTIRGRVIRVEIGTAESRMLLDGEQVAESSGSFRLGDLVSHINVKGAAVPLVAHFRFGPVMVYGATKECLVTCGDEVVSLQVLHAPWISTRSAFERWSVMIVLVVGYVALRRIAPTDVREISIALPLLALALLLGVPYRSPEA